MDLTLKPNVTMISLSGAMRDKVFAPNVPSDKAS
jgi:hypothetical protein